MKSEFFANAAKFMNENVEGITQQIECINFAPLLFVLYLIHLATNLK